MTREQAKELAFELKDQGKKIPEIRDILERKGYVGRKGKPLTVHGVNFLIYGGKNYRKMKKRIPSLRKPSLVNIPILPEKEERVVFFSGPVSAFERFKEMVET